MTSLLYQSESVCADAGLSVHDERRMMLNDARRTI
jgi:hypothetical protein